MSAFETQPIPQPQPVERVPSTITINAEYYRALLAERDRLAERVDDMQRETQRLEDDARASREKAAKAYLNLEAMLTAALTMRQQVEKLTAARAAPLTGSTVVAIEDDDEAFAVHADVLNTMLYGIAAVVQAHDPQASTAETSTDTPWLRIARLGAWAAAEAGLFDKLPDAPDIGEVSALPQVLYSAKLASDVVRSIDGPTERRISTVLDKAIASADALKLQGLDLSGVVPPWPRRPRAFAALWASADVVIDKLGRVQKDKGGWPNGATLRIFDERYFAGRHLPEVTVTSDPADPTPSLTSEDKSVLLVLRKAVQSRGFLLPGGRNVLVVTEQMFRETFLRHLFPDGLAGYASDVDAADRTLVRCTMALAKAGLIDREGVHVLLTDLGVAVAERLAWENANAGS